MDVGTTSRQLLNTTGMTESQISECQRVVGRTDFYSIVNDMDFRLDNWRRSVDQVKHSRSPGKVQHREEMQRMVTHYTPVVTELLRIRSEINTLRKVS
jgi:hypothetical protein